MLERILRKTIARPNPHLLLFSIIVFSLFIKLVIVFNSPITLFSDDAIYAQIARFWLNGNIQKVFHPTWPPLFPFLSAVVFSFTRNWELALRLVSLISGSLIIIPLFFLVKRLFTWQKALIFILPVTFFYPMLKVSVMPLSDMLSTFFTITGITSVFLGIKEDRHKLFLFSSFIFGLNYLTRSEGSLFFVLSVSYLAFYFLVKLLTKKNTVKQTLILIPTVVIFFLTISPYLITTKKQTGSWSLSQKVSAQLQQDHSFELRENGSTWSQEIVSIKSPNYKSNYFKGGLTHILNNLDLSLFLFKERIANWHQVFTNNFGNLAPVFIVLGMLSVFRKKLFWGLGYILFLFVFAIPLTIFATPISDMRYLLWSFPLLLLLVYIGSNNLAVLVGNKKYSNLFFILAFLISTNIPAFSYNIFTRPIDFANEITKENYFIEIKKASEWITANHKGFNPKIMARHEGFEFYTNGETIYTPQQIPFNEVINYGKINGASYLVIWDKEISGEKSLNDLLNAKPNEENGVLFYYPKEKPTIVIYAL